MKFIKEISVLLLASSLCAPSFAQGSLIDACTAIITSGLKNYSIKSDSNYYLDAVSDKYCESNGTSKSSSIGIGIEAVVKAIPVSFTGNYSSSQQAMSNFCRAYSSTAVGRSSSDSYKETIVSRAYDSFDQCIAMAAQSVVLNHAVRSEEIVDFIIAPGFSHPVRINGIQAPENIACYGILPKSESSPPVSSTATLFDKNTTVNLTNNDTLSLGCKRTGKPNVKGDMVFDEAVITIFTNLVPKGNYSVFLPKSTRLFSDAAEELDRKISTLIAASASMGTRLSSVNARFSKVRMQLTCTPRGNFPLGEPPACPANFSDTGGKTVYSVSGGCCGVGEVCRICYGVD